MMSVQIVWLVGWLVGFFFFFFFPSELNSKLPKTVRSHFVDADKSKDLVQLFEVTELPTILLVKDGKGIYLI
jgi:hypothetical protein